MPTAIWWIRRDVRLTDNQALTAALAQADEIVPVFILDPALLASPNASQNRLAFLLGGLRQLDASLRQRGSRLIFRQGRPLEQLTTLLTASGANVIVAEADESPYARCRDAAIAKQLPLQRVGGLTIHPPAALHKANGRPYTIFTPFSKAWKNLPLPQPADILPAPARLSTPAHLASDPIPADPTLPAGSPFLPGEAEAQRRLAQFSRNEMANYAAARNRLDLPGTSGLSPYLRFGMISARQAAAQAIEVIQNASTAPARQGAESWLNELIWREFYVSILAHFPQVRERSFRPEYDHIPWLNDETIFAAWREGRTGYPVVDAAMRQLTQTGWMHNRARMITASFLVKDLLLDWRWGERFFMQHLLDGDPAANNGGWQWTAGVGTDAAPYFRIFNPVLQSQKFDPDGLYLRRWLPELADVPHRYLHTPWEMPFSVQQQAGCQLGRDYPHPIVDHHWARERTLAAYAQSRETTHV